MNKKFGYFLIALSIIVALVLFLYPGLIITYVSNAVPELYINNTIERVAMIVFVLFSTSRFGYFLVTNKEDTNKEDT